MQASNSKKQYQLVFHSEVASISELYYGKIFMIVQHKRTLLLIRLNGL